MHKFYADRPGSEGHAPYNIKMLGFAHVIERMFPLLFVAGIAPRVAWQYIEAGFDFAMGAEHSCGQPGFRGRVHCPGTIKSARKHNQENEGVR